MTRIFISYSSSDHLFVDKLAANLDSLGADVFYAKWEIKVGDSIVGKINMALSTHDHLVVVLSKSSVKSDWVQRELNSSLMRQLTDKKISIKPVLAQDCDIPPLLSDIKYADFRRDYHEGFAALVDSLQEDFALEPYISLINTRCTPGVSLYDSKTLAILLKRLSPLPFVMISVLDEMLKHGSISEGDQLSNEIVTLQLQRLTEDRLVFSRTVRGKKRYYLSGLGKTLVALVRAGLDEGLISPVCSH
jgi:hypothetical protein